MGNVIMAASSSKSSGASLLPIILIVVLFMIVYMTMTRRKRASQAQQMQNTIVPGTRVRTTSGMYGTVTSVEDNDDVMVEFAPGHDGVLHLLGLVRPPAARHREIHDHEQHDDEDDGQEAAA